MKRENLEKAKSVIESLKELEERLNLLVAANTKYEPHSELTITLSRPKISKTMILKEYPLLAVLVKDEVAVIKKEIARLEAVLESL